MNQSPAGDTDELPLVDDLLAKHFGPSPPPVRVEFGAASHTGLVRSNNEDHFVVVERRRTRAVLLTNLPDGFLPPADDTAYVLAVADGMGGAAFGELASSLALRSGWEQAPAAIKWTWIVTDKEIEDLKERLELTFRRMDQALRDRAAADPACAGMGTTLTGAYTVGPEAFVAHVGDSRAYLHRAGRLTQLTRDQTLAQQCRDMGMPVLKASWHHVLTDCLGARDHDVHVEFHHLRLADGDRLLLCTDGLTDMVSDGDIAEVLGRDAHPREAARALVDRALERGGLDNVTAVVARYELADPEPAGG
ncbi:MAG TPA: protein phosphatase 2C domain-containing protein [Gemmataceae bacterium]|jgi:protein phosphatase